MEFVNFQHREACFRIRSERLDVCRREIVRQRELLDNYIGRHPSFKSSFAPLPLLSGAPDIAVRMQAAAVAVGVGPMAAVAGAFAQFAARAAIAAGAAEAVVENGGDIFVASPREITLGVFAGRGVPGDKLAFRLAPDILPLAICSSSSLMGHSTSLGRCDLATVFADDGALADAAATQAANWISSVDDIEPTLRKIAAIAGIRGLLVVMDGHLGMQGDLPELVRGKGGVIKNLPLNLRDA